MIRRKETQANKSESDAQKGEQQTILVFCTCPDAVSARAIAQVVVEEFLAAGVNIVSGVESIYRWRGQIEVATEHQLIMQSTENRFPALRHAIERSHPYDVPEIVAVPICGGLPSYLDWIRVNTVASS